SDFERVRNRYEPRRGDLIVTCVGTLGEYAIVPEGLVFSPDRNLAGIRLTQSGASVLYLQAVVAAPITQIRIAAASGSTAQPHLYLGDLRRMPVSLPPRVEQQEI